MVEKESPPPGILPIFLRGGTCEKFGLKEEGADVTNMVPYKEIPIDTIRSEIQVMGKMSDWEPAKKQIDSYPGTDILVVFDKGQKYGEMLLLCYTEEAKDEFLQKELEKEAAIREQQEAERRAEEERAAAEYARLNVVFEDKPIEVRPYESSTIEETDAEIALLTNKSNRELLAMEITRPKQYTKLPVKFHDKNPDPSLQVEFRSYKDVNFKGIRDLDIGIQVAPLCANSEAQTTWFRIVNKAIQTSSSSSGTVGQDVNSNLLSFLERATLKIENALQQNESVDIFNDTFKFLGYDESSEGAQVDNALRELKNFADPNHSKFKALPCIDWMPKHAGIVAVSAVRNISFDNRIPYFGQTYTAHLMLWDFRLLVKPLLLMQCNHEVFTFRFNRTNPNIIVGGCITGQVVLWDLEEVLNVALHKNNRKNSGSTDDNKDITSIPVSPKYESSVDYSHKKSVADLFWLPPNTQFNYRGRLVADEHLDGNSYQFITIAGDGMVNVWDTRFEQILADELRHIGRAKHVPVDNSSKKEGKEQKALWAPIYKSHLKKIEGIGELSLCKICDTRNAKGSPFDDSKISQLAVDSRSQFMIGTDEGELLFADLNRENKGEEVKKSNQDDEEDDAEDSAVKWLATDHPRPSVALKESPFFAGIFLSVSDWGFNIWKLGENKPVYSSPLSNTYLTTGAWSTTRPALIYVATSDGLLLVWDFTDSSFNPSISLKATHSKITSMEFYSQSNASATRQQLLAVGDEVGTLHIFEVPRSLSKPVHKEESIMCKFLERELERNQSIDIVKVEADVDAAVNDFAAAIEGEVEEELPSKVSAEKQELKKEEEDFLVLEASFMEELGLLGDDDAGKSTDKT